MADRTAGFGTKQGFKFSHTLHGGPPAMSQIPLVASTAYYPGQVLRANGTTGSGFKYLTAAGTSQSYVMASYVASGDAGTGKHPAYLIDTANVFELKFNGSIAAQSMVGEKYTVVIDGENYTGTIGAQAGVLGMWMVVGNHPDNPAAAATGNKMFVIGARSTWIGQQSDRDF